MHACKEGNEKTSKVIKPQLDAPCGGMVVRCKWYSLILYIHKNNHYVKGFPIMHKVSVHLGHSGYNVHEKAVDRNVKWGCIQERKEQSQEFIGNSNPQKLLF